MSDRNKKVKKKEPKQKQSEESLGGMTFAMGPMDLIFEINFDDKDLENPNSQSEEDKYLKIEDMNSISNLSFLQDKPEEFLNTIKIKPNNEFIKQLILGNKISKKKTFIDLICYGRPKFESDEDKFFDRIFDYVTVKNNLQINKTPLEEGSRYSLLIQLRHKKHPEQLKEIKIGTTPSEEKEQKEKEEKEKKEEEEKQKSEKEEEEKKEMEEKKQQKIQQYQEKREEEKRKKEEKEQNKNEGNEEQNNEEQNNENQNNENEEQNKEEENKEENKEEEKKEEEKEDEEEKEEEPEDYEETQAMKEKKIPKFKRKNILCNLEPSCTKYDLIYLNFEEISKIPGDFKMNYLIELLEHFKKKKSNIFINFYKSEIYKSEEEKKKEKEMKEKEAKKAEDKKNEEAKKEEQERKKKEKELKDIYDKRKKLKDRQKDLNDNKKKEIKELDEQKKNEELNNIKTELEQLDENEIKIKDEIRAEDEVKKEYKKKKEEENKKEEKKQRKKEKKEMRQLNEVFFFTDGYFFDTKQACELFNKHYLCHTTDNKKNKKVINKQKVYDYFITAIARGAMDEVQGNKIGLFMEDFNKYNIIYCSKKTASKKELNPQPHPKINPYNAKLIEIYQDIIRQNKNDYYSIFASLAAHEISAGHNISIEVIYPSFLTALEIVKRKVECIKNDITTINDDQLYKVKLNEKALQQELEKLASDSKEGGFILDCTNKSKSTLKDYVALYDYHLRGFFSSQLIRNYLKNKGFIDSKGFIMYDPVYRNVMGAQCKNTKKYEGDELKAKIISNIKNIDVPARLKDKEVDAKKAIDKQSVPIKKKIPTSKELMNQYKQANKKKKKKKKSGSGEGSSSSGQSSSEDEGKSGEAES